MREFLFARVPRDEREEAGGAAVLFGTQNPSESLSFFLAGAERAGNLDENVGLGQINGNSPLSTAQCSATRRGGSDHKSLRSPVAAFSR